MNSVSMQIRHQSSMIKMSKSMGESSKVMKAMNALVKVPEISQTMQEMSREMEKAGFMEEMVEDSMAALDDEELEGDADEEVEKIMFEITAGAMGEAKHTNERLPEKEMEPVQDERNDIHERLKALRD